MSFQLHIPTLFVLTVGINLLLSGFMLILYRLRNRQPGFLCWALSCFLFAIGCLVAGACAVLTLPWPAIALAHTLLVLAPLMIVVGLRNFLNEPVLGTALIGMVLVPLGFTTLLAATHDPAAARLATALLTAAIFAFAFHVMGRMTLSQLLPVRILRAFSLSMAASCSPRRSSCCGPGIL